MKIYKSTLIKFTKYLIKIGEYDKVKKDKNNNK